MANDMVVSLSGVLNIEDMEGKTGEQLINMALGIWNIPRESVDKPFITVHNLSINKHRTIGENEVIGKLDSEKEMVRVVLPLKASVVKADEEKQYLVE